MSRQTIDTNKIDEGSRIFSKSSICPIKENFDNILNEQTLKYSQKKKITFSFPDCTEPITKSKSANDLTISNKYISILKIQNTHPEKIRRSNTTKPKKRNF
ncbi:hypothetical protein HZS_3397 [Henneguya salminicola]|nr:hypothetical protein HZS_3397 [Henneguya salminicola]